MNIVKELRKRKAVQQKELAMEIGVSHATVSAWETGKSDPSGKYLKKVAEYFDVDELTVLGRGLSETKNNPYSAEEERLIIIFRQLNAQGKAAVIANAETCLGLSALREEGLTASMA